MLWNVEAEHHLVRLWGEGHSTAEIGRRLGCSKNSVAGKAHRLGLSRPSPIDPASRSSYAKALRAGHLARAVRLQAEGRTREQIGRDLGIHRETAAKMLRDAGFGRNGVRRHALLPQAPAVPAEPSPPPVPVAAHPLMRAAAMGCRWPLGMPRTAGFRFCDDAAVVAGKPCCAAHCQIAYDQTARMSAGFILRPLGAGARAA